MYNRYEVIKGGIWIGDRIKTRRIINETHTKRLYSYYITYFYAYEKNIKIGDIVLDIGHILNKYCILEETIKDIKFDFFNKIKIEKK